MSRHELISFLTLILLVVHALVIHLNVGVR